MKEEKKLILENEKLSFEEKNKEIIKIEYIFFDKIMIIIQKVINNSPILPKNVDAILTIKSLKDAEEKRIFIKQGAIDFIEVNNE